MNKAVDKLESVKASFEHWRKTRARQGKIPDHLWSQVKELLGSYSLTKICTTLKVSHVQIKENISEVSNEFRFVEVGSPTISTDVSSEFDSRSDRCSIELCRVSGDKLTIHSLSTVHLSHIVTEFMR
jgi:hypothetical protein